MGSSESTVRAYGFDVIEGKGVTRVSCKLDSQGFPENLFFDVTPSCLGQLAKMEPNWALVALLYPAMFSGRDLVVEADISQSLWHSAQGDLQGLMQASNAQLRRIRIVSGLAPIPQHRSPGVATGFSAGIDSFTTLSLYMGDSVPESLRITCLSVHNVGAFGRSRFARDAFSHACVRVERLANSMGLGNVFIDSNIGDVFRASIPQPRGFERTHSFRNAAAAHVLHDKIGCFLYSSAFPFEQIGIDHMVRSSSKGPGYIDPILLPLLSSERMRLLSAGAALSRGQKTLLVSDNELAAKYLEVCVSPEGRLRYGKTNCSRCWKCERTMATLEAVGSLDRFEEVFDVQHYRADREKIMKRLARRVEQGSDTDAEILQMLTESGLRVPRLLPAHLIKARSIAGRVKRALLKPSS